MANTERSERSYTFKKSEITYVIVDTLYPVVSKLFKQNKTKVMRAISSFFNKNSEIIYDIAPYNNVYYTTKDKDEFLKALGIEEKEIVFIMKNCMYWGVDYRPQAAKEPYVVVLMCIIRHLLIEKKQKDAELVSVYLAFTGKFYASNFSDLFKYFPPAKYKQVMDYVINNMMTNKFSVKGKGSVFEAIASMCVTWITTYGKDLTGKVDDDRYGKLIQQLREREKAFLRNIANLYYEAYNNRNYLNYESDNLGDAESGFRLTDNDTAKATRLTENAVAYLTQNNVSLNICKKAAFKGIKDTELYAIMDSILSNKANFNSVRRVVNIMICDFMQNKKGEKIGSAPFIGYTVKAKPNTKDPIQIELKKTILSWLDDNSESYRLRKSRTNTANAYYTSVLMYLAIAVHNSAKND